jgi:hypothetical protein
MNRLPSAAQAGGAVITFARAAVVESPKPERPRPPARRKPVKAKAIIEDDSPPDDALLELPPPPPPRRLPPVRKPRLPAKKAVKSSGVFDVDFFDNEPQASANGDEVEEVDGDSSDWQDDAADEIDEEALEDEGGGFDDEFADDGEEELN